MTPTSSWLGSTRQRIAKPSDESEIGRNHGDLPEVRQRHRGRKTDRLDEFTREMAVRARAFQRRLRNRLRFVVEQVLDLDGVHADVQDLVAAIDDVAFAGDKDVVTLQ